MNSSSSLPYFLGINGGIRAGYQDIAAVLIQGNQVIAAVEEERINRVKHTSGQLPLLSVSAVLKVAGISMDDVAALAFHGSTWEPVIETVIAEHFQQYWGYCPPIYRYHHHLCHAASAYHLSGQPKALIITLDGSGDGISTQIALGNQGNIEILEQYSRPQSLGLFYSMFTQWCGFTRDRDEYKLMGLAAYGNPSSHLNFEDVLSWQNDRYHFRTDMLKDLPFGQAGPSRYEMMFSPLFTTWTGTQRRKIGEELTLTHQDLAAGAQKQLEEVLKALVRHHVKKTGVKHVVMAGGVALNCKAIHEIEKLPEVETVFVQPAAHDAGVSLGAALLAAKNHGFSFHQRMNDVFWGISFHDDEIEKTLQQCGIPYQTLKNPIQHAAQSLANQQVIAWFQGKMEFGPRALGNRSILAHPAQKDVQQLVNQKIKFREGFRPFGAAVIIDDFHQCFDAKAQDAPFMTHVYPVKADYKEYLKGVTHVDGTCRVQTVSEAQNPMLYELLRLFRKHSGFGVLLNTSFNLNHEPIVCTPREAISSFFASGLDALYIGSFLIRKSPFHG